MTRIGGSRIKQAKKKKEAVEPNSTKKKEFEEFPVVIERELKAGELPSLNDIKVRAVRQESNVELGEFSEADMNKGIERISKLDRYKAGFDKSWVAVVKFSDKTEKFGFKALLFCINKEGRVGHFYYVPSDDVLIDRDAIRYGYAHMDKIAKKD